MADSPLIYVQGDERVIITGANGTGKTTLVKKLLLPRVPKSHCVVILDPKRDKEWVKIPDVPRRFRAFTLKPGVWAYRWPETDELAKETGFVDLMRTIWKKGNVLIISDETQSLFPGTYTMTRQVDRLNREGRQRGIGWWWLMQRPSAVPMQILTEAESWAVFTLRNGDDRDKVAKFMGDEVREPLPPDGHRRSHNFWWLRRGMVQPKVMRLNLS